MLFSNRLALSLLAALSVCGKAPAQSSASLCTIGNSFSDHVIGISTVALSLNRTIDFGRHMIPGAGLGFIWNNPASGIQQQGYYPQALPSKAWDFVTLQPWDETPGGAATAAGQFASVIYSHHAQTRVFVLATPPVGKLPASPPGAWAAAFTSEPATNNGSRAFFEHVVSSLRASFPGKPVALVPIQHVLAGLDWRLGLGQTVPETASLADILDATGHFNPRGRYLAALTLYSTMFRVAPAGAVRENFASGYSVSQAFAEYAWQLVWDVVSAEPFAAAAVDGGTPQAVISATGLRGIAPLNAQFDGSGSYDSDGTIVSWAWDFGDGGTAAGPAVSRAFAAGVHPVTLTVTDNEGRSAQARVFAQARSGAAEPVALDAENAILGSKWRLLHSPFASLGKAVVINPVVNRATTSPEPVETSDIMRFEFTAPASGNYTMQARVSAPSAEDDAFFARVNGGAWVNWNNIGTRSAAYVWAAYPSQIPLSAGPAVVEFAWRENGTVLDKIQLARATAPPSGMGLPGVNVPFDDTPPSAPGALAVSGIRVNGVTLSWTASADNVGVTGYTVLRNGTPAAVTTATSAEINGLSPQTAHTLAVVARDAEGNLSPPGGPLVFTTPPNNSPTARITASALEGVAPLTFGFSGGASSDPDPDDVVIGYQWDFGAGPEGDSVNQITRQFSQTGAHTVTLTVVDLFGAAHSASVQVTVHAPSSRAAWRAQHFGVFENTGEAADTADPNGNGLSNILEYASGPQPALARAWPAALGAGPGGGKIAFPPGPRGFRLHHRILRKPHKLADLCDKPRSTRRHGGSPPAGNHIQTLFPPAGEGALTGGL